MLSEGWNACIVLSKSRLLASLCFTKLGFDSYRTSSFAPQGLEPMWAVRVDCNVLLTSGVVSLSARFICKKRLAFVICLNKSNVF